MTVLSDDMARQIREGREAAVEAFLEAMVDLMEATQHGWDGNAECAKANAKEALRTALDCVVGI